MLMLGLVRLHAVFTDGGQQLLRPILIDLKSSMKKRREKSFALDRIESTTYNLHATTPYYNNNEDILKI